MVIYTYDAWGNYAVVKNTSGIAELNPFRYRGYYYDTETDLYFLQTRYYDPEVGRFISQDDVSYLDPESINGLNLYAYCGNNPVMRVDPTGQAPEWWQWVLFGVGAALVVASIVVLSVFSGGTAAAGFITAVAVGAAKGALIGAVIGTAVGIAGGAIYAGVTGADIGESILSGFLIGFGVGAIVGAVIGGTVGGIKFNANNLLKSYKLPENSNYDCSEIAEDLLKLNKGKGKIMRITAKNGSVFNVSEGGIINSGMYYHDVYKYFGYIIDPRYGQVVSKFSYMNVLKAINNGAKFILSIL